MVGGNYVRCLAIVAIYMELEEAKKYGGGFKVTIWRGSVGKGPNHKEGTSFYGGVDPSIHHEGSFHYAILLL